MHASIYAHNMTVREDAINHTSILRKHVKKVKFVSIGTAQLFKSLSIITIEVRRRLQARSK